MILDWLQNRALRFVCNLKIFDHISAKVWSILGFSDLKAVNMVHKILLTGKPEYVRYTLVFRYASNILQPIAPAKDEAGNGGKGV